MEERILLLDDKFPSVIEHFSLLNSLFKLNNCIGSNYSSLKPKQVEALKACKKSDTTINLYTGYGKSLIFYLLPFLNETESGMVVSSPLNQFWRNK